MTARGSGAAISAIPARRNDKRRGWYPTVIRLWDEAWAQFIPLLDYDLENPQGHLLHAAIESLNTRYRS
ncbi:hypothetical protein ACIG49_22600 [Micromonospora rosaria]|uniref:hypothetical protein n=1 Tax=Micromonospora rosaria TaxID=47874 RepID=UPI0012F96F8F|nr:hypothetical protein [Micromonospora rosaria]